MGMIFFYQKIKNRASSRLLAQNRVSPRAGLLKAVYLEALLYIHTIYIPECFVIIISASSDPVEQNLLSKFCQSGIFMHISFNRNSYEVLVVFQFLYLN